ncbi:MULTISPECIES: dienelactone hydrolase family protein [Niastella]|uniref:Dienelactone hydrolase family protein n=1 Tax=Niastella soli TaxID=2821487 RepID=A0ABS3Z2W6_9BACT|nr:dienelactone hydrolase family protein [Niastella soli]MBO9204474.1 dienelactone hydrolase family protein [Niastella soli]
MTSKKEIHIHLQHVELGANLVEPANARGLVVFAHGSGSSRMSPRNNFVADVLNKHHMATLLTDLLTAFEDEVYENRFDIALLSHRLIQVTEWASQQPHLEQLSVGYFGASTGAASALQGAAMLDKNIKAVVSRGGRPDLAVAIKQVKAPTLLIVGSRDTQVMGLNTKAYEDLCCEKNFEIVEGASHLFEEPGALHNVANLAASWFEKYL